MRILPDIIMASQPLKDTDESKSGSSISGNPLIAPNNASGASFTDPATGNTYKGDGIRGGTFKNNGVINSGQAFSGGFTIIMRPQSVPQYSPEDDDHGDPTTPEPDASSNPNTDASQQMQTGN